MKVLPNFKFFFITIILMLITSFSYSQDALPCLTRGADTAEIYLSCPWYVDSNYVTWVGLFHSTDNGKTLSVMSKTNMQIEWGGLFGDSIPGRLFKIPCRHQDTMAISYDYGVTFEAKYFHQVSYSVAGCMAGELYTDYFGYYRGINYGDSFTYQSSNEDIRIQDVGSLPGELYAWLPSSLNPVKMYYSNDFAKTFTCQNVVLPEEYFPIENCKIIHGTQSGEIYFVVWQNWYTVLLFHSFDNGQTITFQSFLPPTGYDFYTAGRTPGTFYYTSSVMNWTTYLWIYFSRDYGVTFTTYFHDLDSTYTSSPATRDLNSISVYPNPASDFLTVEINPGSPGATIELVNILGDVILQTKIKINDNRQTLDVRDLPKGLYLVKVTPVAGSCKTVKVVIE